MISPHLGQAWQLFLKLAPVISLILATVGCVLAGYQFWSSETHYRETTQLVRQSAENKPVMVEKDSAQLIVSVMGAVLQPAVVTLPPGSRVADALSAAGGVATESASHTYFQTLNLAEKVTDGQQIIVPVQKVSVSTVAVNDLEKPTVNSATAEQLDAVEGLGATRVNKLIQARPFTSWDDFQMKLNFPEAIVENLKKAMNL